VRAEGDGDGKKGAADEKEEQVVEGDGKESSEAEEAKSK
jgi:hypothetical protein